jgi:hypothetical protein
MTIPTLTTPTAATPTETRTWTTTRSRRVRIVGVLVGVGALAGTIACGTQAAPQQTSVGSQQTSAGALSVNCGAGLQAIIRPATVNGQAVSQVDCVPTSLIAASQPSAPQPTALQAPGVWQAPQPTAPGLPAAPAVPTTAQGTYLAPAPVAAAPVMTEPVTYRPARVVANDYVEYQPRVIQHRTWKPRRSVRKSAIIIGSSAGIGAAIGGAFSGGKGALIGAALGGGGAALWDQATRH